jgi:preprotein translocase subunit YajC
MLLGFLSVLLAEDPPAQKTSGDLLTTFALWAPIILLFYVLIIWMPRRQEKKRLAQMATLKKNDKIINSGGIIGIIDVVKENEDEIVLRGGLRITKSSVQRVIPADAQAKAS